MLIEIQALDTLIFRDGKPFSTGETTWVTGNILPFPSTIYGALRTAYFSSHIDKLELANTENDPTKNLKIKNIYFSNKEENGVSYYMPLPANIVQVKEEKNKEEVKEQKNEEYKYTYLKLKKIKENYYSNKNINYIFYSEQEVEKIENLLIKQQNLNRLFKSEKDFFENINILSNFYTKESKVGIARNKNTLNTREGYLYNINLIRYSQGFRINVEFEGLDIEKEGFLRLGGESKLIKYKEIENKLKIVNDFNSQNLIFFIYLSTPAIFKNGYLPSWINPENNECNYKDLKIDLLSMIIGEPIYIGGFDMKENRPKPMKRAVPAGSIYYFKAKDQESFKKAIEYFNGKSISDYLPEQGFGISYIGVDNEQ